MSGSGDPTLVDSATLFESLNRDLAEAHGSLRQAYRWLDEARATVFELKRRYEKDTPNG